MLTTEKFTVFSAWSYAPIIQLKASEIMKKLIISQRQNKSLDLTETILFVNELIDLCKKNDDNFLLLARCKGELPYSFSHPFNVCVYSLAIGKALNFKDKELFDIGIASFLHDIGESRLPERMLIKSSKYTESEFSAMHRHPELGYQLLKKELNLSDDALLGILQHHERLDGTGYPSGHMGRFIHPLAKIISVCESFDAMSTPKSNTEVISMTDALKNLYLNSGKYYESSIVQILITLIGTYPIGSIVRISSGQAGVVIDKNKSDQTKPIVLVVSDKDNQPIEPYVLDLLNDNLSRKIAYPENPSLSLINPFKYIEDYYTKIKSRQ